MNKQTIPEQLAFSSGLIGAMYSQWAFDAGSAMNGEVSKWIRDPGVIQFASDNCKQEKTTWFRRACSKAMRDTRAKAEALIAPLPGSARSTLRRLMDEPMEWPFLMPDATDFGLLAEIKRCIDNSMPGCEERLLHHCLFNIRDYAQYSWALDLGTLAIYDLTRPIRPNVEKHAYAKGIRGTRTTQ